MPSWELFDAQDDDYRDAVLPPTLPTVSVEAGVSMGWERWVDRSVSIDRFGASAPGDVVLEKLGITGEHVAQVAKDLLSRDELVGPLVVGVQRDALGCGVALDRRRLMVFRSHAGGVVQRGLSAPRE